jgi:hypothetical protein
MDAARRPAGAVPRFRPDGHDCNHARGLRVDRAEARPDGKGGYPITLPHGVIDRLGAMRRWSESYRADRR